MTESIEDLYFDWLCARAFINGTPIFSRHERLLRALFETEYIWLVVGDDNRLEEGLELKREFSRLQIADIDTTDWSEGPCSVLEMLIAFAARIGFHTGESSSDWFWEFIVNLGLDDLEDSMFQADYFLETINAFVWRTYDYSGVGGLFPLANPTRDQRQVEVWYQFSEYITEKEAALKGG